MAKKDYLLLNLIFCLNCGNQFTYHDKPDNYEDDIRRRVYRCTGCSASEVAAKKIEDPVIEFVERSLNIIKLGIDPYVPSRTEKILNRHIGKKRNLIKQIDETKVIKDDRVKEIIELDKKINKIKRRYNIENEAIGDEENIQAVTGWLRCGSPQNINEFLKGLVRIELDTSEKFGFIILIRKKDRKLNYPECVKGAWGKKFMF